MITHGDLAEVCLGRLLMEQVLANRTFRILAFVEEGMGQIYARGGEVIHASLGILEPQEALFAILLASSGKFCIQPLIWDGERTIEGNLSRLYLPRTTRSAA